MRSMVLVFAGFVACSLALPGCSKNKIELDTKSTIRYDSVRDGVPKDMGGPGGGKGKKGGAGAGAPP